MSQAQAHAEDLIQEAGSPRGTRGRGLTAAEHGKEIPYCRTLASKFTDLCTHVQM